MNFMDVLRRQFDRGGIKMGLELPKKFLWADGVIPAKVTLTGHKTEPRKVVELCFKVQDDEKTDDPSSGNPSSIRVEWIYEGGIDLAPGQVVELDVGIVLPAPQTREEKEAQAFGRAASGFLEKAFVSVAGGPPPESFNRYLVTAEAEVEGVSKPKRASKHIQQGRGITFGIGGATMKL